MTQSIIIFILIAVGQAVASYFAKKAKEKQAAAEAATRGDGALPGIAPSLDGTRPVQVNSVRSMSAPQAFAVGRLIEQGNVIEAIMALRAICNLGLAEARDVVNQFPARGFPAELLPPGQASSRPTSAGTSAPPPPPIDRLDPEAASQDGEDEESGDALHSLAGVRAAVDEVRARAAARQSTQPLQPPPPPSRPVAAVESSPTVAKAAAHRSDRSALAESVAGLLRSRDGARRAILMAEVLGPPRAFRPLR